MIRYSRWMFAGILAIFLFQAGYAPTQQTRTGSTQGDDLTGLWGCETVFGPEIRGEMTVVHGDDGWIMRAGGYQISVPTKGDEVRFKLPGGQGEYRGKRSADSSHISGYWIQPSGVWLNNSFATPLTLARIGLEVWRGEITPLDDRFSLYLNIARQSDETLVGVFRNPEAGATNGARQFQVTVEQEKVQFNDTSHPGRTVRGTYDAAQKQLTIETPMLGRPLILTRRSRDQATGFFPVSPAGGGYKYRQPIVDGDGWQTASPSEVGIDEEALTAIVRHIGESNPIDDQANLIHSVSIARHGKLVLDEYFFGFDADRTHDLRSASKAIVSVLVGVAMAHHLAINPDTPVYSFFPSLSSDPNFDPRKRRITLAHLMTHSSGLACDDNDRNSPGQENTMQRHRELDWYKYVLDLPVVRAPGETWAYCSGGINLVGGALRQVTHDWIPEYFNQNVAKPLQFGHYYTQLMPDGEAYMGGGMYLRPRDFLKIGQVYLDGGKWHGIPIVDAAWVKESTQPLIKGYDDVGEGYAWHIYSLQAGGREYTEIEANGTGGQIIMILPELDLTVVFTAGNYNSYSISRKSRDELVARILIPGITGK